MRTRSPDGRQPRRQGGSRRVLARPAGQACRRDGSVRFGLVRHDDTHGTDVRSPGDTMTPPVPLAPHALSIDEAAARIENGELTSLDLTRAVLDVCARRDDELRAYITRDDEVALAQAAR